MSTTKEPDCGSSSCMFSSKGGMRTNGPCRCMENAGFHGSAVMAAKQMLREVLLLRAELAALKAAHAWIKTSERMPCPHVAVLGSDANGVVSKVLYFADDIWGYADDSNSAVDDPITHWMPLPEAPQ